MNTRIALSSLSILASLALMGGATLAYFSDAGTSSGNTFSTGTLNLKLTDEDETIQDAVTASFGDTLAPDECTGNQTLSLQNSGSIAAHHAEVTVSNSVTDTNDDAIVDMDAFLRINLLTYDGSDVTSQIPDTNTNGFKDLADWAATAAALDSLALTDLSTDHPLVLDVCLDASAENELQGDSVASTFTVTLNQDSTQ